MTQPELFAQSTEIDAERTVLYALGDFQSRGKILAGRELALDRLLGAFNRAAERFGHEELSDEKVATILESLGAKVKKLPTFVAKHPYRVTVTDETAVHGAEIYKQFSF
jgi:hypothetical protein